jgi:phosphoribosyl-AMP cyclohydrolase / phosphoribosyl-ATP pyrophosphohydrolase
MATVQADDQIAELPRFDEHGLLPCIAQDFASGEVLMFAYMNEQALQLTRSTGELHLWSRSRGELWRKGQSSGNVMSVRSLRLDCDGDCLLALVEPAGPACHTGERTCFFRDAAATDDVARGSAPQSAGEDLPAAEQPCEALPALERTLQARVKERPEGSYTVTLLNDPQRIGEKVMEEAEEVARAAREESDQRVDEEAADVLYHLLVLLHSRGRRLADAAQVLIGRAAGRRR